MAEIISDSSVTAKAIVQHGKKLVEETVTLPPLKPHEVLVRVQYAALNPTDMLAFDLEAFGDGAVLGCDFAGIVEQTGSNANRFNEGDRVAAFTWGGEIKGVGAYSEYCIADENLAFKVPNNISLEQASTFPLAAATAYLALFSNDCLALKRSESTKSPVLIWGGSSTVGAFAVQLAAAHGIDTIATASEKNTDVVLKTGAQAVFDYKNESAISKLSEKYPNTHYVFDTIGNPTSTKAIASVYAEGEGKLCTVRPGKTHTENLPKSVEVRDVFVFTVFPKEHSYRGKAHWPINHENVRTGSEFFSEIADLISSGKLKPRPVRSLGKLTPESLEEGLKLNREGKVSNEKLCWSVGS